MKSGSTQVYSIHIHFRFRSDDDDNDVINILRRYCCVDERPAYRWVFAPAPETESVAFIQNNNSTRTPLHPRCFIECDVIDETAWDWERNACVAFEHDSQIKRSECIAMCLDGAQCACLCWQFSYVIHSSVVTCFARFFLLLLLLFSVFHLVFILFRLYVNVDVDANCGSNGSPVGEPPPWEVASLWWLLLAKHNRAMIKIVHDMTQPMGTHQRRIRISFSSRYSGKRLHTVHHHIAACSVLWSPRVCRLTFCARL